MLRAPSPRTARRRTRIRTARRISSAMLLLAAGGLILAAGGCGVPPELRNPGGTVPPAPAPTAPTGTVTPPPASPPPTPPVPTRPRQTGFSEHAAVDCNGNPSGDRVMSLLRRDSGLLTPGQGLRVTAGPLCAGSWQYTVVTVPGREPLQVVSRGPATALELITAGTDVCAVPVRSVAPAAIRAIACYGVQPTGPGL